MCDFTQREYYCGHFRWIASKWCQTYTYTHKRCRLPNVTHFEYRHSCGECKPKECPHWYHELNKRWNKSER
ncbi:hypothetical protein N657DRAFT_658765 [Parathielavia appendiculata]|uniref:Uncharacterized protein n=1 Tax=Parathielavia appendiculata TaxID=2587402 RepID=A0AAN6TTN0_9PEZI|nr:hypothetical protein N657DRAFT_658765 [Parathielavia appendiculata]